ncbi:enhanced serine sensitivity protein SseB [Raoultella planticola]|uniref:Enhanced serine sensitivity protein SseB n=1 Tax=Raoultella planticola TaxID=575 RepID=A0A485C357_RAOPL|nr:enhanced serine sensitivity protein SseB [Raoultella planticola]
MSETKNELETLLEKAATEPGHRPAFFRTLLESTVWVPGAAAEGEQIVEESAVDLQHWEKDDGASVIPFFTSLEALQQAVEDETIVCGDAGPDAVCDDARRNAVPQCEAGNR